jgi:hypothetical protein
MKKNYIYDYLGRKLVERNSAGVSTVYVVLFPKRWTQR